MAWIAGLIGKSLVLLPLLSAGVLGCEAGDRHSSVVTAGLTRLRVAPDSTELRPGGTIQLSATGFDGGDRSIAGVQAVWRSSDTTVAWVDETGLVRARRVGTATITAASAGVEGAAIVTVTSGPGGSSGDPLPAAGDAVLLDTRAGGVQSMQSAATWPEAIAASTLADENNNHGSGAWQWAPNFDGKGTHAFQGNIINTGCGDVAGYSVYETFPSSYRNITVQYKFWLSKNPNDTSHTALGSPGSWTVEPNAACAPFTSTHGQHKRLLLGRTPTNSRADLIFTNSGSSPTAISIEGWYFVTNPEKDHYIDWQPELHVNQVNTITFQVQAESSSGAKDGVIRLWINGQLAFQTLNASVGTDQFYRMQLPSTVSDPKQYQTEYIWDVVAWTNSGNIR